MDECGAPISEDDRGLDPDHREPDAAAAAERARGRASILAGQVVAESPLHDGGRWGISAVFRPVGQSVALLAEVAAAADAVAGHGHWVHGPDELHLTIRAMEPHRSLVPPGDQRLARYAAALDRAAVGLPVGRVRFCGLSPHPGGVAAVAYPRAATADRLRARLAAAIDRVGGDAGVENRPRLGWYVNILHFAARVPDPARLVAWCDDRRDLVLGVAELPVAELVGWSWTGVNVRAQSRHVTVLGLVEPAASGRRM